jgi:hypothetical protein
MVSLLMIMVYVGLARTASIYVRAVYDRMIYDIPAKTPYVHRMYVALANPRCVLPLTLFEVLDPLSDISDIFKL